MRRRAMLAAAVWTCVLAGPGTLDGNQALSLQVSPVMAAAPAFVSVRALVDASDENRSLEIVAQSPEFFRSSQVDLDGRNAPRLLVFEFQNLPPGLYAVDGILVGAGGKRVTASRLVKIVPSPGSAR